MCCILPRTRLMIIEWRRIEGKDHLNICAALFLHQKSFEIQYFHKVFLGLSPQFIICEKIILTTLFLFNPYFYLQALYGSVKACNCWMDHGSNVCPVWVVERIQLFVLDWYTVSSGEKASFQKGSPDICCIVEYGVSGTMLISCVNQKDTAKSTFWITAVILLYLHVFKVKLSKHPFAYLYHDF